MHIYIYIYIYNIYIYIERERGAVYDNSTYFSDSEVHDMVRAGEGGSEGERDRGVDNDVSCKMVTIGVKL
jgi:hypothetical protein